MAQVVAFAFGLAAATFFPALFLGIFYKRLNKEGAITGMLGGLLFTASYIIYFKFINPDINNSDFWLLGISPEGIGCIGMILNFALALSISIFTNLRQKKFLIWWMKSAAIMLIPELDPVAIQIGPLAIRWYGLTWLAAFSTIYFLIKRYQKDLDVDQISDLMFYSLRCDIRWKNRVCFLLLNRAIYI